MSARLGFAIIAAVLAVSCNSGNSAELIECKGVVSQFFGKPPREVVAAFEAGDLDTKYRIYLCGNQAVHPPALYLAAEFAKGREGAVAFLRDKLAEAGDITVRDIVRVFGEMQRQGTYNVRADAPLMKLLGKKVQAIRDEDWRRYCVGILSEIIGA